MDKMWWLVYGVAILAVSGLIGMHLGRFREAYTEMTGMMTGMTMGMLNGFLLGYCAASATNSMFWGNLIGILLGLALGAYFGRAGALMGIMDGAMGGVMGGAMGAMLAVMVVFPPYYLIWTAVLLGVIYIAGMVCLVVLIEQSAPEHAALHRLLPMFARAVAKEAAEEAEATAYTSSSIHTTSPKGAPSQRRLIDYYALLGVPADADEDEISKAYLEKLEGLTEADQVTAQRIERALAILTDPHKRRSYDRKLADSYAQSANGPLPSRPVAQDQQNRKPTTVSATVKVQGAGGSRQGQASRDKRGQGAKENKARGHDTRRQGQGKYYARQPQTDEHRVISVSWVGLLAFVVIIVALGWWVFSVASARPGGQSGGAPGGFVGAGGETQAQLDQAAVVAPMVSGKQTMDVVLDSARFQYKPKVIKVKQGIPVHFSLTAQNGDPG
jgi:hypothetical protein